MIDRIEPTLRPGGRPIGFQKWRSLLFLHWPVPSETLRALVPPPLELDLYEGQALVGVVPFVMRDIHPWWWPRRLAFQFLETNVRTYVHYRGEPGVYFLSLDANHQLAVWAARHGWGLPYHVAAISMEQQQDSVRYRVQRRACGSQHSVHYRPTELLGPSQPDTAEHWLLERYLLFTAHRGRILRGQVHHAPYPAQRVELLDVDEGLIAASGLPTPDQPPLFAHYASGVDVDIFPLQQR